MPTVSQYVSKRKFGPAVNRDNTREQPEYAGWRDKILADLFTEKSWNATIPAFTPPGDSLRPTMTDRKLSVLWAGTAHDIKNQLTGLRGYISLAGQSAPGAAAGAYLAKAELAAGAIAHQIEFASMYQEVGLEAAAWQDVAGVVAGVVRRISPGGISVRVALEHMEIFADPMLWQVFSNLIDNAARHGRTVHEIHIFGAESPDFYTIIVLDDGIGIPSGEKEKIFMKGYGNNTGLGLYLIREILSVTGITIRETGRPGRGARFEIMVPEGQYRFLSPVHEQAVTV